MKFNSIFRKIFAIVAIALTLKVSAAGQTTVPVGEIQNGAPILTTSEAQFNSNMSTIFSGRIYSNLQLFSATDSLGTFYYYLKVSIAQNGATYSGIVTLDQSGTNIFFSTSGGCEMKCSWTGNCTGCDQNIIVKCKSQKCTCNATSGEGFGGCTSSITFPD